MAVRVPPGCLEWELKVREAVGESVSRGRLDIVISTKEGQRTTAVKSNHRTP